MLSAFSHARSHYNKVAPSVLKHTEDVFGIRAVGDDRLMLDADRSFPEYGFVRHKGYATPEHLAALDRWGPCPLHRRTFAGVWRQGELFVLEKDD